MRAADDLAMHSQGTNSQDIDIIESKYFHFSIKKDS